MKQIKLRDFDHKTKIIGNFLFSEWEDLKLVFKKKYADPTEEYKRQQIYFKNQEIVAAHNRFFEQGLEPY